MNKLIKAIVLKITFTKAIILFASDLYTVPPQVNGNFYVTVKTQYTNPQ